MHPFVRAAYVPLALLSVAAATVGAVVGWDEGAAGRLAWVLVTAAWAAAAVALVRRADDRLGVLALGFCALAGFAALTAAIAGDRPGDDALALTRTLAVALLPAVVLNLLLAVPSGTLATRAQRLLVVAGYLIAGGVGVLLWTDRPSLPPGRSWSRRFSRLQSASPP